MLEALERDLIARIDLERWLKAEAEERQTILQDLFAFVCDRCDLDVELRFTMPEDFAAAEGLYDAASTTLYLNRDLWRSLPATDPLFTLFHEARHLLQAKFPDDFSEPIRLNATYVLQYDGTAYKLKNGEYRSVRLDGKKDYLLQLYLASPAERDANLFAHRILKAAGAGETVDRRLEVWLPDPDSFSDAEADAAFLAAVKEIDRLLAKQDKAGE